MRNDTVSQVIRSPELMNVDDTVLLVVDVQERIVNAMRDARRVVWNCQRLIDGAGVLGVAVFATEQAPDKLGPTVEPLATRLPERGPKLTFSCCGVPGLLDRWGESGRRRVLLCGVETHVCVQQTALDLQAAGFLAYVAVDAVSSRHAIDHEIALRRMESAGVTLTTCEAALTEWAVRAGTPEFKQISVLAKEAPPE